VLRAVQRFEAAKVVGGAVRRLKTVDPVGEDAGRATYTYGVVWVVPCARVSPGGLDWCGFRRNFSGRGHKVCRGDEVCRVLFDGVGDRLMKLGVRFQVDEKETDVGFKLLPEAYDGVFVVRQCRFKVGEEAGVLSDEVGQSLDLLEDALCAHKRSRWCPE
jgi:hypothetical protein